MGDQHRESARVARRKATLLASAALIVGAGVAGVVIGAAAVRPQPAGAQPDADADALLNRAGSVDQVPAIDLADLQPAAGDGFGFVIEGDDGVTYVAPVESAPADDSATPADALGFADADESGSHEPDADVLTLAAAQEDSRGSSVEDALLDRFRAGAPVAPIAPIEDEAPEGIFDPEAADGPADDAQFVTEEGDFSAPAGRPDFEDPDFGEPDFGDPDFGEPGFGDDDDASQGGGALDDEQGGFGDGGFGRGGLDDEPAPRFDSGREDIVIQGGDALPPSGAPGACFARVYVPGAPIIERRDVVVREATFQLIERPAEYRTELVEVVIEPEHTVVTYSPAVFRDEHVTVETAPERIAYDISEARFGSEHQDVETRASYPAWRPGRGPLERIDEATGEIMCRVSLPAHRDRLPFEPVSMDPSADPVVTPAVSETYATRVLVSDAQFEVEVVPAVVELVEVQVEIRPARIERISVPAVVERIDVVVGEEEGALVWREILCANNTDRELIRAVQRALRAEGFDAGPVDGRIGPATLGAVRAFQRANGLAEGGILLETLDALGVARPTDARP